MRPRLLRSLTPQCLALAMLAATAPVSSCAGPNDPVVRWVREESREVRLRPIVNIVDRPIPAEINKDSLWSAFRQAARKANWSAKVVSDAEIEVTHPDEEDEETATAAILFGDGKYSILYRRSQNLFFEGRDPPVIHWRYNWWVEALDRSIQRELKAMTLNASSK